jgi:hypothetical protein
LIVEEGKIWIQVRALVTGNVERGHIPRSMFLVPERGRSGSGNNLV